MDLLRDNVTSPDIYREFYKFGRKGDCDFPEGPELYFDGYTDDIYKLNWFSIEDIDQNLDLLDHFQQQSMKAILNPHVHHNGNRPIFVTNAIISIMANASFFQGMCFCGTKGCGDRYNKYMWCNHWRFCDRCANKKRQKNYRAFSDYYDTATENMFFVTLTLANKINFNPTTYELIDEAWNRLNTYAHAMFKAKMYSGAIVTEEFSIDSLDPHPIVNPHIHFLCTSPHELTSHVFEDIKVDIRKVVSKQDWVNKIDYLTKSVDLGKTYIEQWTPENAEVVNRNVKEVIQGYKTLFPDRKQSKSVGIFHKSNKHSIVMSDDEYRNLHKSKKKTCKKGCKKIQYTEPMYKDFEQGVLDTLKVKKLAPATTSLLKHAYVQANKPKPESHWLRNTLALGGLGLAGAYTYGRFGNGGNNPLTGFTNQVNNRIVDPLVRHFKPGFYSNQASFKLDHQNDIDAYKQINNNIGTANATQSYLHPEDRIGTPWENTSTESLQKYKALADNMKKSLVEGNSSAPNDVANVFNYQPNSAQGDNVKNMVSDIAAKATVPIMATGYANQAHAFSSLLPTVQNAINKVPGLTKALPGAGTAAAVLAGAPSAISLADQMNTDPAMQNVTRLKALGGHGLSTIGGQMIGRTAGQLAGRILAGGAIGGSEGRILGPVGAITGAVTGAMATPMLDQYARSESFGNWANNLKSSNNSQLIEEFSKAIRRASATGDNQDLRLWYGALNNQELGDVINQAKGINTNLAKQISDNYLR